MKSILRFYRDVLRWDVIKIIITHSPEVPTGGRNVVWLRRVGQCTILRKTNTLRGEDIEFRLKETQDMRISEESCEESVPYS
jgi:hypothetical protein